MKKIIFTFLTAVAVIFSLSAAFAADSGITIYFNGTLLSTTCEPVIENGTTLVPLSDIANAMGTMPDWDAETKTINIRYNDLYISMRIGNTNIAVYNARNSEGKLETSGNYELKEVVQSLIAPKIINGYTYIPLKALSEAFGAEVEWDGETKTIRITAETADSSVTFKVEDDTLIVSGHGAMEDYIRNLWTMGNYTYDPSKFSTSILPDDVKKLIIGNGITHIGNYAFAQLFNLESVVIPDSVTSIGDYAFFACPGLKTIELPSSIVSIGYQAFTSCASLETIKIPSSTTSIGRLAFTLCGLEGGINVDINNKEYQSIDGVLYNKNATELIYCPDKKKSITIPSSVKYIGENAFAYADMTSITIPDSVTDIGDSAFESCRGLTSITVPNSVTDIGDYAFEWCSGLTNITIPSSVKNISYYSFLHCTNLKKVYCEEGSVADNEELYPDSDVEFVYLFM